MGIVIRAEKFSATLMINQFAVFLLLHDNEDASDFLFKWVQLFWVHQLRQDRRLFLVPCFVDQGIAIP